MQIFGLTSVAGRLVSVTFSLLALWVVFEFCNRMYGPKNALLASILLGTMPGFFWVSRITMLETILLFFFTVLMFVFYSWITKNSHKALLFSGIALGIGILAKYEMAVAAVAMAVSVLLLCRKRLKISLAKLIIILIVAILVVAPWFLMVYQLNGQTKFQTITYVMQSGAENRPEYSNRFFSPVFYLIELTWPFNDVAVNPVSLPIMILKPRHLFTYVVSGGLRFLYRYSKQAMALRGFGFPNFSYLGSGFYHVSLWQNSYVEAQADGSQLNPL
jgi:4-amino-4-deoxy-L-arabinose transferase-like glycosyltransferase